MPRLLPNPDELRVTRSLDALIAPITRPAVHAATAGMSRTLRWALAAR